MLKLLKQKIKSNNFFRLERIRLRLKKTDFEINIYDAGAGSRFDKSPVRSVKSILRKSCSSLPKTLFVNFLIKKYHSVRILELGTCLGINALRLAAFNPQSRFISVDADPYLIRYAHRLKLLLGVENVEFVKADFDSVLENLLKSFRPDFIFMDGNHRYDPTMRYFSLICELASQKTIILIDDIDWSREMKKVWKDIDCQRIILKRSFVKMGLIVIE